MIDITIYKAENLAKVFSAILSYRRSDISGENSASTYLSISSSPGTQPGFNPNSSFKPKDMSQISQFAFPDVFLMKNGTLSNPLSSKGK